jgi:DHA1 family multidrug resistance protein-like MFS transporter
VTAPVLSPIVGGWVASRNDVDWIWTNWITLIISGFAFLVALFFLPETNVNVLLSFKAKHLRHITGDNRYTTRHERSTDLARRLLKVLPSSIQFLVSEPAILSLGTFLVLLYILLFTFLSGFEYIFKNRYNLTPLEEGACFASIALGSTAFSLAGPGIYIWTRHSVSGNEDTPIVPESRLWPAMVAAPLLPVSLFWLGWTDYATISLYSGLSACFCFGIVLNAMYVSSYEYIIDSYGEKAALGLAGVTMMRYIVAGGMVIAARPMYEKIGVHWTMTLLGCVALVLTPAPYVLFKRGTELRKKSPHASNVTSENKEET